MAVLFADAAVRAGLRLLAVALSPTDQARLRLGDSLHRVEPRPQVRRFRQNIWLVWLLLWT